MATHSIRDFDLTPRARNEYSGTTTNTGNAVNVQAYIEGVVFFVVHSVTSEDATDTFRIANATLQHSHDADDWADLATVVAANTDVDASTKYVYSVRVNQFARYLRLNWRVDEYSNDPGGDFTLDIEAIFSGKS